MDLYYDYRWITQLAMADLDAMGRDELAALMEEVPDAMATLTRGKTRKELQRILTKSQPTAIEYATKMQRSFYRNVGRFGGVIPDCIGDLKEHHDDLLYSTSTRPGVNVHTSFRFNPRHPTRFTTSLGPVMCEVYVHDDQWPKEHARMDCAVVDYFFQLDMKRFESSDETQGAYPILIGNKPVEVEL